MGESRYDIHVRMPYSEYPLTVNKFDSTVLEKIAKIIGDSVTGGELTEIFSECGIEDNSGESTKWRRIYAFFIEAQNSYHRENDVVRFIECWGKPVRFVDKTPGYSDWIKRINNVLEYEHAKITENGKMIWIDGETNTKYHVAPSNKEKIRKVPQNEGDGDKTMSDNQNAKKRIFIVHGHDEGLKEKVARIISEQDIDPIILAEQPNMGSTIIEKLEKYTDVDAAICLLTADDEGREKGAKEYRSRARQNVILETGYCMSKVGRSHIIAIYDDSLENPSDLEGIARINRNGEYMIELLKELKGMGFKIDMNRI